MPFIEKVDLYETLLKPINWVSLAILGLFDNEILWIYILPEYSLW